MKNKISRRVKSFLDHESDIWAKEGVITAYQRSLIVSRYETTPLPSFYATLFNIGMFLIGLGIISFIAANWNEISKACKISIILGGYLGIVFASEYCRKSSPGISKAMLVLADLVYGAGIFLMSQIFHQHGHWTTLFFWWIIGSAPAYLATKDIWQLIFLQLISLVYVFGSIINGYELYGFAKGTQNIFMPIEPIVIVGLSWLLWYEVHRNSKIFHLNVLMTTVLVGYRLSRVMNDNLAFLIMLVFGITLIATKAHIIWGLLLTVFYGIPLTYASSWHGLELAYSHYCIISIVIAVVIGAIFLYLLCRGQMLAGVALFILIGRYFFDSLLGFMTKATGFVLCGVALLALGIWIEKRGKIRNSKSEG